MRLVESSDKKGVLNLDNVKAIGIVQLEDGYRIMADGIELCSSKVQEKVKKDFENIKSLMCTSESFLYSIE